MVSFDKMRLGLKSYLSREETEIYLSQAGYRCSLNRNRYLITFSYFANAKINFPSFPDVFLC